MSGSPHSDLVDGLVALMNSNYSLPVNLGNPDEHTILEFAEIVRQEIGELSPCRLARSMLPLLLSGGVTRVNLQPSQQDDPHRRRPNIARAQRELSWTPVVCRALCMYLCTRVCGVFTLLMWLCDRLLEALVFGCKLIHVAKGILMAQTSAL